MSLATGPDEAVGKSHHGFASTQPIRPRNGLTGFLAARLVTREGLVYVNGRPVFASRGLVVVAVSNRLGAELLMTQKRFEKRFRVDTGKVQR